MQSTIGNYLDRKGLHDPEYSRLLDSMDSQGVFFAFFDSSFLHLRNGYTSGDLDLICSLSARSDVLGILRQKDFSLYAEVNTHQYLFAKVSDAGELILIHIHFDLYLYGSRQFEFFTAYDGDHALKYEYQILSMILFCLAKRKVRKFERQFLEGLSGKQLSEIYSKPLDLLIENSFEVSRMMKTAFYFRTGAVAAFGYLLANIWQRAKSVVNDRAVHVVFLGVDGAGKSTLIEAVGEKIENRLVVKKKYFGLKQSFFNQRLGRSDASHNVGEAKERTESRSRRTKVSLRKIKSVLIFCEYVVKLARTRVTGSRVPVIWLYDRSYIDRMMYDQRFMENAYHYLMGDFRYIFVTGNIETLYARKAEVALQAMGDTNQFYSDFLHGQRKVVTIDSTKLDREKCCRIALSSIVKSLPNDF